MLNTIHRSLAGLILLFVIVHLCNHLVGLAGIDAHIHFMEQARKFYRNPFVEPVLLSALAVQVSLGLYFVYRSWGKRYGFFQRAQAISGCYIAFFLFAHISATLNAREALALDTNFYFATAGIHAANLAYFFVPYYFLAVVAIFVHVASASHWALKSSGLSVANRAATLIVMVGIVISLLITASLIGAFYEIAIPSEYGVMFG